MEDSYISRRDKIVASAIELIGDLGLHALTPKNLARKQNISDTLIYKYFGGIDEVLIAVVNEYAAFDVNIQRTVERLDGTYLDKIKYYADTYATYYDNYIGMGAIMLHYEELLHMSETREIISECMLMILYAHCFRVRLTARRYERFSHRRNLRSCSTEFLQRDCLNGETNTQGRVSGVRSRRCSVILRKYLGCKIREELS